MESNQKPDHIQDLTFRDRMATVDKEGKRVWVFPKMPKGKFTNYRRIVAYFLLAFFYLAPHIKLNGDPLIFLNFLDRRFVLLGQTFYPQDFHLLVLSFITLLVFIILFTVVYGRIFCGWACPQTVFMEFLYRPIEYLIDGDRNKQRELARQEMNVPKLLKRIAKHTIFVFISFFTVLTFLSYIIGWPQVRILLAGWPFQNFAGFLGVAAFTGAHYFVFAWFREQVCSLVCPYGRLQGVMLEQNSIVVAYDYIRGEPRGRGKNEEKGDCIDCKRCVDVCPTGIDIRNGTQLECINCTACIDACASVMYTVNKPKGLIRYASERSISEKKKEVMNARAIAYSVVLVILLGVASFAFMNRDDVETTIVRTQGTLFQQYGDDALSNLYDLQMINKSSGKITMDLKLLEPEGEVKIPGDSLILDKGEVIKRNVLIILPKSELKSSNTHVIIGVYREGQQVEQISSSFVGPNSLDVKK
ncbi:cytochrome c oxidase accessory protein CcoG [Mangrovibacterium diazotrophicum]|uniref:Cytochrome c oxidase accessory protein FixG n=1 Tax=Mangrovibacterium diazotrophicum TaxID=1261403 RepID=A0A419W7G6_9BACT|nr:cytochrome c oxidase accessory protein CcoG [Mangrovibacterium diazotrophicum]RKD91413.1 cytochrome c oxidase accessory protein FixG [Mangrovibacterium diazotrophicum]